MLSFFLKSAWFSPLWYLLEQILTNCLDFCNENKALKRSVSFRFCATLPKRLKIHHCSYIQKCSVLRNHTFQLFSKHSSGPMFYGSVYHSQLFFCSCFKLCPRKVLSKLLTDKFSSFVKVSCSFVQVYQDKVYDLLNPESNDELCVREHPRKGIYVANLSHHRVDGVATALELLNKGRKELVIAETKMVRHSSRSHAIFQLSIERRLDPMSHQREHVTSKSLSSEPVRSRHSDGGNESEIEENGMNCMTLEEDIILKGKFDICDLAGSERLGKTMAEGVRLSEAKHINSSLLELGNVIYALSEGTRRHIPFRNSTLTRLLQECLGPQCRTSFIVCVGPTASEAYETRCSLNFGTRARNITNKERLILNVEVDYKILARRLSRRIEYLEKELGKSFDPSDTLLINPTVPPLVAVQTQTDGYLEEEDTDEEISLKKRTRFPQLEIIIISEIMTSFWQILKARAIAGQAHCLCSITANLFNELLSTVAKQHDVFSLKEDHWAEADIKQLLKDSMLDIDLLKQLIDNEANDILPTEELIKQTKLIGDQFDERCIVIEQDINYCVEKFQDIVAFRNDSSLQRKMKQLIEVLDNNYHGDIADVVSNISLGFDVDFMSWLVSAHMALRFITVLLKISMKTNALDICHFDKNGTDNEGGVLNETFESITSINDDSTLEELDESYASTNSGMGVANDDVYAKSSTPKRGHCLPLWIQNQLFSTSITHASIVSRDSFYNKAPGCGGHVGYNDSSYGDLNDLDPSDVDSIDGYMDDTEISHEEQLQYTRAMGFNVMKLEEKCELLEDKNSKLRKTLNIIMKENKELNEKLRVANIDKSKLAREVQGLGQKLQMTITAKRVAESNFNDVNDEKTAIENEITRYHSELKHCEIEINGFRRQVSMRDGEIESLRKQIAEMKTEAAASKADGKILCTQIEEAREKYKVIEQKSVDMANAHEMTMQKLRELCKKLEKAGKGETEENRIQTNGQDEEATFEMELFVAIENNIRIEGIVNDVKDQLHEMVGANEENTEKGKREGVRVAHSLEKATKRKGIQMNRSKEAKTNATRKAMPLRRNHKSFGYSKERDGIPPKGSKIKELMNEKLRTEMDNKELVQKNAKIEEELKTAKTQIEMLVKECGVLDHQLLNMKKQLGDNVEGNLRLEMKDISRSNDSSLFLRTKEINELEETREELKENLEILQNKIHDLESELTVTKEKNSISKRHAKEIEKKYEAAKKQLRHFESENYNQNIENGKLRDHVIQLSQELSREQQKIKELSEKLCTVKERNAMHIKRLEGEMMKFVKKLDRYREKEKERRQQLKRLEKSTKDSSEADSGLITDHIDDIIDLT